MSLGEKMSLTGELETSKTDAGRVQTASAFENYEKQMTQQSDAGHTSYSSKQYKVNPLLLDDSIAK